MSIRVIQQMLLAIAIFIISTQTNAVLIEKVEIFTADPTAIQRYQSFRYRHKPYHLTIYNLNRAELWKQKMSENLSTNEATALEQVNQKIQAMGGQAALQKTLMQVYSPLLKAMEVGLDEFPAVVINRQYVIYGTDNIKTAMDKVQVWQIKNGR